MSARKYYLRINHNIIINLNEYRKYGDMTNVVSLSLFTSDFESVEDIAKELKEKGLLRSNTKVDTMEVVKSYRDNYYFVTSPPLLYREAPYFDVKIVKKFFRENLYAYSAIGEILDRSKDKLETTLLLSEYTDEPKEHYLEIIKSRLLNIQRLELLVKRLKEKERGLYDEYSRRLNRFVEGEILYRNGDKVTTNYAGLIEMARTLRTILVNHPNLYNPASIIQYEERVIKPKNLDVDPDEFMFLEEEDFKGLYSTEEPKEVQLLNLEERKKRI